MKEIYESLRELEELDDEIAAAMREVDEVEAELETVSAPVEDLQKQVDSARGELEETKQRARHLERGAKEKREKLKQYEERLTRVRTSREEAAVNTELDLVRKAADADESEALEMMERVTRQELRTDELASRLESTREEVDPQRESLIERRDVANAALQELESRRQVRVDKLDPMVRDAYTRIKGGKRGRALAAITADGACGNCYSMLPLQRQNEVRRSTTLIRCEFCGVILHAPD